jgi:DnaK suppressor protein
MDESRARTLLQAERAEVEALLADVTRSADQDRDNQEAPADYGDAAQPLESEGVDDAVEASLRTRLEDIERAEQRLADGTFGVSVRSGTPIPDERLEVAPTAELTVEEASAES